MAMLTKTHPLPIAIALVVIFSFHLLITVVVVLYGQEQFRQLFLYSNLTFSLGMLVHLYYVLRSKREDQTKA